MVIWRREGFLKLFIAFICILRYIGTGAPPYVRPAGWVHEEVWSMGGKDRTNRESTRRIDCTDDRPQARA
jgi:hypothetical protein